MDKEELKQRCLNVIEEHRDEIIALGKEAYKTPELGFKELFRSGIHVGRDLGQVGLAQGGGDVKAGLHHVRLPPGCS